TPGIGVTSLLFCSFQDLKEKKEVVEETENGRDAPANGNARILPEGRETSGLDPEVGEGPENSPASLPALGWLLPAPSRPQSPSPFLTALLSPQDDDVDPKKQKTDEDD
uniref:Uncharacterized protein n=1 Tax=Cyanistes caeruleus TaxID=156563 RepID=A0A8C0ZEV6_CYACU